MRFSYMANWIVFVALCLTWIPKSSHFLHLVFKLWILTWMSPSDVIVNVCTCFMFLSKFSSQLCSPVHNCPTPESAIFQRNEVFLCKEENYASFNTSEFCYCSSSLLPSVVPCRLLSRLTMLKGEFFLVLLKMMGILYIEVN